MNFLTSVHIETFPKLIEHDNSILTIGSCFAENMGTFFTRYKFNSLVNPFGVLYNSASIKNSIQLITDKKIFSQDDLIFDQEEYHSFYHHSNFSSHNSNEVINKINSVTTTAGHFLDSVDWVIISLGTSFVYRSKKTNFIVSNCHKIPQKEFDKEFLSVEQNTENLISMINLVRNKNPKTKFILTISPIRHWKDGAHQNQLSKASLHLAIDKVSKAIEDIFYFPSYEIQIDELRDYRFYAKDMIHPNDEAIEYIWNKFSKNFLSKNCLDLIDEIDKIVQASKHRVRNVNSQKSKEFAAYNISKIKKLVEVYPYLDFQNELKQFYSYLGN